MNVTLPAQPDALPIKLAETALIVVDMQNAYASPGGYLTIPHAMHPAVAAPALRIVTAWAATLRRPPLGNGPICPTRICTPGSISR